MRILAALGGNALLPRGEPMKADAQHANVRIAAEALTSIHTDNELVITHWQGGRKWAVWRGQLLPTKIGSVPRLLKSWNQLRCGMPFFRYTFAVISILLLTQPLPALAGRRCINAPARANWACLDAAPGWRPGAPEKVFQLNNRHSPGTLPNAFMVFNGESSIAIYNNPKIIMRKNANGILLFTLWTDSVIRTQITGVTSRAKEILDGNGVTIGSADAWFGGIGPGPCGPYTPPPMQGWVPTKLRKSASDSFMNDAEAIILEALPASDLGGCEWIK
jgi:hypothetical protein